MVLNNYRKEADSILAPIAKKMSSVDPNTLSWIAFFSAVLAGVFFYLSSSPMIVLLGGVMVLSNSFFDAMDGKVAKMTGKDSIQGDFLDHSLDRYSDIFIIGGIAMGPLSRTYLGFLALLGILMTSYMGTQAHAVGVGRDYGGVAGRADRLILLLLFPILYVVMFNFYTVDLSLMGIDFSLFEILMVWFAVAGQYTAIHRGISSWKELKSKKGKNGGGL